MHRLVVIASIAVSFLAGCSAAPSAAPAEGSASGPTLGGTVQYQFDGAPATTEIDVVADGASVSGSAITTTAGGTHTVRLGCVSHSGDTWALGGTIEQTTIPGERAGDWSAVIVKEGSPQQIGIWFSDPASKASDCEEWLASTDFATIDADAFNAVESGVLLPPPEDAP